MTDDQKRLLTLFLGECWHILDKENQRCSLCGKHLQGLWLRNPQGEAEFRIDKHVGQFRTFLTAQDQQDCKDKLVEKGLWVKFVKYCEPLGPTKTQSKRNDNIEIKTRIIHAEFYAWLERPVDEKGKHHFCKLVIECPAVLEFIKKEK